MDDAETGVWAGTDALPTAPAEKLAALDVTHHAEAPAAALYAPALELPPTLDFPSTADRAPVYRLAGELAPVGVDASRFARADPREAMTRLQAAVLADPVAAASAEAGLELSPSERREVQRRLRMTEHDPKGVDGIFGPGTRAAVAALQEESGLAPTGYVTGQTLAHLIAETDAPYRAWRVAEAERRERQQLAAASPLPRPKHAAADGCARLGTGEIAYGRNFRCDFRGLGENLSNVGGKLARFVQGATSSVRTERREADGA